MAGKPVVPSVKPRAPKRTRAPAASAPSAPIGPTLPTAAPPPQAAEAPEPNAAKRLLRAGIKALGEVQGDVLARQARVFEILLGIGQSPGWSAPRPTQPAERPAEARADAFGRFEHVFDERVARSLQRLGMPSADELRELAARVERLDETLRKLQNPPRRKR